MVVRIQFPDGDGVCELFLVLVGEQWKEREESHLKKRICFLQHLLSSALLKQVILFLPVSPTNSFRSARRLSLLPQFRLHKLY
ncbi:hypothetical protein SASPL_140524 [Salvia splendens]|uniref:Uncharacterized protein n=1 Tax=Salvia splendens TaxID=180675 RepID=A0A8X8WR41_SALSN|nr:hypothetical protein SASPL_140524 [Salvia splendens]